MATIKRFEDLEIWQIARRLCKEVFNLTNKGPFLKDFKFRDQIRSSSGSVMDNIAEGFERSSRLEFVNFLSIAKGSAGETRSQLYRSIDAEYCTESEANELIKEYEQLAQQIAGFISYLNQSNLKGQKFKDRE
jgi:four helix bundle protein